MNPATTLLAKTIILYLFFQTYHLVLFAQKKQATNKIVYNPEKKYSPDQLRNDLGVFKTALEKAHPGLFLYQIRTDWETKCQAVLNSLNDSLTEQQFYRLLLTLNEAIRERHSTIELSKSAINYQNKYGKLLPFNVKIMTDTVPPFKRRVFVDYTADSTLLTGTELIAINNRLVSDILQNMISVIPTDGVIITSKYRDIERKFSTTFANLYGESVTYDLQVRTIPKSLVENLTINGLSRDSIRKVFKKKYPEVEKEPLLNLKIFDQDSIAYLCVNTFSHLQFRTQKIKYKKYLRTTFNTINKSGIQALVLDLRRNLGGRLGYEARLFSYLSDTVVDYIQYTIQTNKKVCITGYTTKKMRHRIMPLIETLIYKRLDDGSYIGPGSLYRTQRPPKNRFKGKVYVLIGGQTGSAAVFLCTALKEFTTQTKFIGEETGGGYSGFTAGRYWKLKLPNTGILTTIPLIRFVTNVKHYTNGRGLIPDIHNLQFLENKDLKGVILPSELRRLNVLTNETQ